MWIMGRVCEMVTTSSQRLSVTLKKNRKLSPQALSHTKILFFTLTSNEAGHFSVTIIIFTVTMFMQQLMARLNSKVFPSENPFFYDSTFFRKESTHFHTNFKLSEAIERPLSRQIKSSF